MTIAIQNACLEDASAIAEVHISSAQSAYQGLFPKHLALLILDATDVEKRTMGWHGWLKRSRVSTIVARAEGAVVGFCALHSKQDKTTHQSVGEIAALYVLPTHWRQGIGHQLGMRTLVEAKKWGYSGVEVWVLGSNGRARSFYHSLGFRPNGQKRIFLEWSDNTLHELRYRKALS